MTLAMTKPVLTAKCRHVVAGKQRRVFRATIKPNAPFMQYSDRLTVFDNADDHFMAMLIQQ